MQYLVKGVLRACCSHCLEANRVYAPLWRAEFSLSIKENYDGTFDILSISDPTILNDWKVACTKCGSDDYRWYVYTHPIASAKYSTRELRPPNRDRYLLPKAAITFYADLIREYGLKIFHSVTEVEETLEEGEDGMSILTKYEQAYGSPWKIAEACIKYADRVLLYGIPGTGKTTAGNKVEIEKDQRIWNVTLAEEMPSAELRGHYHMVEGNFVWKDGPATAAFRQGGRLVLNEVDKASGDVHTFLHNLLDDKDIAVLDLPNGDRITAHPNFKVVATMNGVPMDLPEALRDRFAVNVNILGPHVNAITSLPEDLQVLAMKFSVESNPQHRISFRQFKEFSLLRKNSGDPLLAAQAIFGGKADDLLAAINIAKSTAKAE